MRIILGFARWRYVIFALALALAGGIALPSNAIEHPIASSISLCLMIAAALSLLVVAIGLFYKFVRSPDTGKF
jgi:hypothetical protein